MAFICSPSPSAYPPPPTPGRDALGLHSPSPRVCTRGRTGGRRTQPNFLGHMGLPKILTHGAPLARFARRSSAINSFKTMHPVFFIVSFRNHAVRVSQSHQSRIRKERHSHRPANLQRPKKTWRLGKKPGDFVKTARDLALLYCRVKNRYLPHVVNM